MPRYFFNLQGFPNPYDGIGTILEGPEEARSAAVTHVGEMLTDIDGQFWGAPEWRLQVIDEQGATVCTLTIKGATGEA